MCLELTDKIVGGKWRVPVEGEMQLAAKTGNFSLQPRGMPLQRKDCLCEIAPTSKWQATLWIDQRSRQFLSPGQHVNVCLDAFPGAIVTGTIAAIGVANEPEIPSVLSIKFGGHFASKTTDGGESPTEPVYQATVLLDEVNLPVQRGMRGTGRFTRSPRTIGSWLTDEFHQLFVAR